MAHEQEPLLPSMRTLLRVAAFLVFLAGLQLYLFPLRTEDWFAWTIDVPMTAVFLGASYWSSAVLEVAGSRAAVWGHARLSVWTVFVFTTLTLVVTLVHLDKFHLGAEQPLSARLVTWGWLAIYAGVPVAMLVIAWRQTRPGRPGPGPAPPRVPLATGLRALLVLLAVVLVGTGVVLLVAPATAEVLWAWPLTDLTARAVGAWLVGLGWAAGHARLVDDVVGVRPLGWTGSTFVVLQAVALARYGDAVAWSSPSAFGYLAGLALVGLVSVLILVADARLRAAAGTASASPR
jgi:hypothetical protein